ncbi:MAG: hypothetical protein ACO3FE_01540 [Planctomycetaceae bacterium]|jgi:hypothetical protein
MPTSLHQQLCSHYVGDSDRHEVRLGNYRIDAIDGRGRLIEVQCASLSAIRDKIRRLLQEHRVIVVKPIAARRKITRLDAAGGTQLSSRYSPRRQKLSDVFDELVHFGVFPHPRLQLDIVLTEQEEIRIPPGKRASWRKKYSVEDRLLVDVQQTVSLKTPTDLWRQLDAELPKVFTTLELSEAGQMPRWLARKAAFCFRRMGFLTVCGKRGNAVEYRLARALRRRAAS